jgi:hypothetical protein
MNLSREQRKRKPQASRYVAGGKIASRNELSSCLMEEKVLGFLGTAFMLLNPKAMLTNGDSSEEDLTNPEKKLERLAARQDEEKEIKPFTETNRQRTVTPPR